MATPSPVHSQELEVTLYTLPHPPVARTIAFARKMMKRPFSRRPARFAAYRCVGCLNRRHMVWAWMSLFWVAFADVYVRLCAMGVWHDWRIF